MSTQEAEITINGAKLSKAQSMTLRVAIESFSTSLTNDGLGDDPTGKAICEGYLNRISEIRGLMYK